MSQDFSQRLKDLREQHGYTQDALASELYVSRQAISQWENGKSSPDVDKLVALAKLYSISVDELLNMVETPLSSLEDLSSAQTNEHPNSNILEQLALAVVLVLALQVPFLPLPVTIFIAVWMKKTKRNYTFIYLLCLFIFLFGSYNTFVFITHYIPDWGTPSVTPL